MGFDAESALHHDHRGDEALAVEFLASLAGAGPVLELAIGTGRIALPLAARGLQVDGIDIAPAMVDRLRSKPGGDQLRVELGNFAEVPFDGPYSLVFVVWNTLFNLESQDEQIRCFENVARCLGEGGCFVVEAFVPSFLYRMQDDQRVVAESVETDSVRIGVLQHDPSTQTLAQSHVSLSEAGVRLTPVAQRYAWPHEIDLMARLAGLRLDARYADWQRRPFGATSESHVSVYRR